jgi:signal transduction histidine kinase
MPLAIVLRANGRQDNFVLGLAKTPWYTLFYRHPILAFAGAFVPLTAVIALIWIVLLRFRQKNRIIARQRDELRTTLHKLREAQEKLVATEKFQQARDIVGGVAHEIRNALYPAIAGLDSLGRKIDGLDSAHDKRIGESLELSQRAVTRAIGMIDLARQYSRLELERSDECVELQDLCNEIRETNAHRLTETGARWTCTIENGVRLPCRRAHAFSLVNNLVTNAIDAVAGTKVREVKLEATAGSDGIRIVVSDSGVGIPDTDRERVFNAFYSTKPQAGTGLGLAMVRRIAELYGGSISVSAVKPQGTSFSVILAHRDAHHPAGELHTHEHFRQNPDC